MKLTRRSMMQSVGALPAVFPLVRSVASTQTSDAGQPFNIVLLSGWNIKNIGDVAHTPGFLRLVQRFCPEAKCTVAIGNMRYYKETGDYLRERFPECGIVPRPYSNNMPLDPEYKSAFERADVVVLGSGMTMSYAYYGHDWDRYMGRVVYLEMARNAGKPYGVYGHSFDRMDPPAEVVIGGLLTAANFVYTRDSESLELLKSKGVRCPEMAFGPDAAFGFDLRDREGAAKLVQRYDLEPGRFLVFIPRLDLKRFAKSEERSVRQAEIQREMIIEWVRSTGETVIMVAEVEGQIEPARREIYERLPADVKESVRFKPDFWWPDEAASLYLESRAVVSLEMHSVIMALAAGVPALHPYFTEAGLKQYMMRDIGLEEWMSDIDDDGPGKINAALAQLFRNTEEARGKVRDAMAFVEKRQRETMEVVRQSALAGRSG